MTEHLSLEFRAAEGVASRSRSHWAGVVAVSIGFFAFACGTSDLDVIERLPVQAAPPPAEPAGPPPQVPVESPVLETDPSQGDLDTEGIAPPTASPAAPAMPASTVVAEPSVPSTAPGPLPSPPPPVVSLDGGSPCDTAIVPLNLYRLRSQANDRCLAAGNAGFDGYDVILSDCTSDAASWQLIASAGGAYELRNVLRDYNVDIEFANVAEGSNVVLFAAPGGPSQKFFLTELSDGTIAVTPRSAPTELCLQADAQGVRLELCIVGEPTQKWHIDPDACMPE